MARRIRWRRWLLIVAVVLLIGGAARHFWAERSAVESGSYVLLDVGGNYAEEAPDGLAQLFGHQSWSLLDLLLLIRDAGEDPRVTGMVVRVRPLEVGWAKTEEIRAALLGFRRSGKPLHAYIEIELTGGMKEYYLASAAERIHVPPGAAAPLTGMLAQFVFLGGVWEKLDIEMQVVKIREYKTMGDMLANKEMSPFHREMANSILDSLYGQVVDDIAAARDLDPAQVRAAVDAAPATFAELHRDGLADGSEYLDEIRVRLVGEDGAFLDARDYAERRRPLPGQPAVRHRFAIVYGSGPITTGESEENPFDGEATMGSDTLVGALNDAAKDEHVDAIVFRVDSPGGSALAADLIWRGTRAAGATKPVIVSMSDVAASGGYYAAAGASRIFADAGTLTGSIGVVLAKPNVKGFLGMLGITTAEVERGQLASMMSLTDSFNPAELQRINATMDAVYDLFLDRVASGRRLDKAQVDEVGRGRVWTGAQARENGLIDELGGLLAAIDAGKIAVGIPAEEKVELVFYPARRGFLERLSHLFGSRLGAAAPPWWLRLRRAAAAWRYPSGSTLALMPAEISIH